jgi:hypothetical protein
MLVFLTPAFALDCTGLDPALCAAVDQMAIDVNAQTGFDTVSETAPIRRQPATLYALLEALQDEVVASGCVVEGYSSGVFEGGDSSGTWRTVGGADTGAWEASYVPVGKSFSGDFSGDASGPIGNGFGRYNRQRQHVANWGGDFVAGVRARIRGGRGVVVSLHGSCLDVVTRSVDTWYRGDLSDITPLRVFASSRYEAATDPRPWTGVAALDARCQDEADAVFGVGETTFLAAVTDLPAGIDHPADRFEVGRPLVRSVEGSYLEADVFDLFDFTVSTVAVPVNTEADGTSFPLPNPEDNGDNQDVLWWGDYGPTAGLPPVNGVAGEGDCAGWTAPTSAGAERVLGGIPFRGSLRTHRFAAPCGVFHGRSYCVEVDD